MGNATTHPAETVGGDEVTPAEGAPSVMPNNNNCDAHCVEGGVCARHTMLNVVPTKPISMVASTPANLYQRLGTINAQSP